MAERLRLTMAYAVVLLLTAAIAMKGADGVLVLLWLLMYGGVASAVLKLVTGKWPTED